MVGKLPDNPQAASPAISDPVYHGELSPPPLSDTEKTVRTTKEVSGPIIENQTPTATQVKIQVDYTVKIQKPKLGILGKISQRISDYLLPDFKNGRLAKLGKLIRLISDIRTSDPKNITAKERAKGGIFSSRRRRLNCEQSLKSILKKNPNLDDFKKLMVKELHRNETYADYHPREGHHIGALSLQATSKALNENNNLHVFCAEGALNVKASSTKNQYVQQRIDNRRVLENEVISFKKTEKPILNIFLNIDKAHWTQVQYNKETNEIYLIDPQGRVDNRPGLIKGLHETLEDLADVINANVPGKGKPTIIGGDRPNEHPSIRETPLQKEAWTCGAQCVRNILLASAAHSTSAAHSSAAKEVEPGKNKELNQGSTLSSTDMLNVMLEREDVDTVYQENQTKMNSKDVDPSKNPNFGVLDVFEMITTSASENFDKLIQENVKP